MIASYYNRPILDSFFYAIIFAGWCGYILFSPLYVFETGVPQPADILLLSVSALAVGLFLVKRNIQFNRVFVTLLLMIGLFSVINLMFYAAFGDATFYFSAVYYIFNALAFGTTIILFKDNPQKFIKGARIAIIAAIIFEIVWTTLFDSKALWRETGSFNNPNQLGYWVLLSAACIVILNYGRRMPLLDLAAIMACAYMITDSLSRGAMISFGFIALSLLFGRSIPFITKIGMVVVFLLYGLFTVFFMPPTQNGAGDIPVIDRALSRLDLFGAPSNTDQYIERGYDRLIENPAYLITGSGEGAYWRFMDDATITGWAGLEIHSGLATILFSYGIFGFFLFGIFIFTIIHKTPPIFYITLAAIMVYGLAHQHVRFTGFWIYLGLVYGMSRYALPVQRKGAQ